MIGERFLSDINIGARKEFGSSSDYLVLISSYFFILNFASEIYIFLDKFLIKDAS
jgi:hypothetical protein